MLARHGSLPRRARVFSCGQNCFDMVQFHVIGIEYPVVSSARASRQRFVTNREQTMTSSGYPAIYMPVQIKTIVNPWNIDPDRRNFEKVFGRGTTAAECAFELWFESNWRKQWIGVYVPFTPEPESTYGLMIDKGQLSWQPSVDEHGEEEGGLFALSESAIEKVFAAQELSRIAKRPKFFRGFVNFCDRHISQTWHRRLEAKRDAEMATRNLSPSR